MGSCTRSTRSSRHSSRRLSSPLVARPSSPSTRRARRTRRTASSKRTPLETKGARNLRESAASRVGRSSLGAGARRNVAAAGARTGCPRLVVVKTGVMLLPIYFASRVYLYPAENGCPDGVAGFCWLKFERRVRVQCLSEFLAALLFTARSASDEGEIFVRLCFVAPPTQT